MIHVLIERKIAQGMIPTYEEHARNTLQASVSCPGFISGEAFTNAKDAHHRFVLCKWRDLDDWINWKNSPERAEQLNMISPILLQPEKIVVLEN